MTLVNFISIFFILINSSFAEENKTGWTKISEGYMDPVTKIIWGPEIEPRNWSEAKAYCSSLELGAVKDWRLPTVRELQSSVCQITGYPTRTPCPKPRNHERDLWVLNMNSEKNINYWAADLIPGDPYNTYYFIFDVEGQHIITSKNDKARARCIRSTEKPTPITAATTIKESKAIEITKQEDKKVFKYYISALAGFGAYLSNEYALERYPYFSGDLRVGFNTNIKDQHQLYITLSGDIGTNLFKYPVTSTITIGTEYFIYDYLSCLTSIGVGIISDELNIPSYYSSSVTNDTYFGLGWKAALNLYILRFGENDNFAIPISASYSGIYTSSITSHIIIGYLGLAYYY